jgi:hypothetical protein
MKNDQIESLMMDVELGIVISYATDWLKGIKESSSTLSAAFQNSAFKTMELRSAITMVEKDLKITPVSGCSLEKRLVAVADTALQKTVNLDERWDRLLPKLRTLAAATENHTIAYPFKKAKAMRAILAI